MVLLLKLNIVLVVSLVMVGFVYEIVFGLKRFVMSMLLMYGISVVLKCEMLCGFDLRIVSMNGENCRLIFVLLKLLLILIYVWWLKKLLFEWLNVLFVMLKLFFSLNCVCSLLLRFLVFVMLKLVGVMFVLVSVNWCLVLLLVVEFNEWFV